jgi:hypothetical protein
MTIMTMEPAELGESPKNKFTNMFLNVVFYMLRSSLQDIKNLTTYVVFKHFESKENQSVWVRGRVNCQLVEVTGKIFK